MSLNRAKKESQVAVLGDLLGNAESVTFVGFHGLSVKDTSDMRRALREGGVGYKVVKKTLVKRALEGKGFEGEMPSFPGELAVAVGKETAPAREVYTFVKKFPEALAILGGVFEGAYLSKEAMTEIAQIPSMQVLRGMFVNLINSPIQRFVIALGQIAEKKS